MYELYMSFTIWEIVLGSSDGRRAEGFRDSSEVGAGGFENAREA